MIVKTIVFLCLSVIVQQTKAVASDETSKVIEVTTDSIDDFFSSTKGSYILEFYSNGCIHCKNFENQYEKLASRLANENFK